MIDKRIIITAHTLLILTCWTGTSCTKRVKISEKSKKLFGKVWIYDIKAVQKAILSRPNKATDTKKLMEIEANSDPKKPEDYLTARSLYFAADKKGRGVGFYQTIGKGISKEKFSGWLTWDKTETQFILSPANKKYKKKTYTIIEILPDKLVLLDKESVTQIPEIYRR